MRFRFLLSGCALAAHIGLAGAAFGQSVPDEVVAAVLRDFPPEYSVDADGTPTGLAIDLMDAIAEHADLQITYRVYDDAEAMMRAIERGEVEIIPNAGILPFFQEYFDFTATTNTDLISIFVRASEGDIDGVSDLAGKAVAIHSLVPALQRLQALPGVRLEFDDPHDSVFRMLAGQLDAVVFRAGLVEQIIRDAGLERHLKVVGPPVAEVKRAVAVRKGNPALFARLDAAVRAYVGTPAYEEVMIKWYGQPAVFWTNARIGILLAALFLLSMFAMAAWRQGSLSRLNRSLTEEIAQRARIEGALREAKEQAERGSRAKSEFLAMMSHELRTPLNAIIGFSEVIANQNFGPDQPERYKDYAADINGAGIHLLELITDILDLSKVEAGLEELHEEVCDPVDVTDSVLRLVRGRAQKNRVALTVEMPDDLPALQVDRRKLKQILVNLLSNAIKFSPGGTTVLRVHVAPGHGYVFEVADTGIGIAAADISVAFEQFRQVDNALTRKHDGSGLGLPLTKALVDMHGGVLELNSEPGVGTTVTVRFPAARTLVPSARHKHLAGA